MAPLACQWEVVSGCRPLAQSGRQLRGNLRSVKKDAGVRGVGGGGGGTGSSMGTSENEMSLPI